MDRNNAEFFLFIYIYFILFLSGMDRNNARMKFLNFFAIFFGNFLAWVGWNQIWDKIFFFLFLGLSQPGFD